MPNPPATPLLPASSRPISTHSAAWRRLAVGLALGGTAALGACGGGGSGTTQAAASAAAVSSSGAQQGLQAQADCGLAGMAQEVLNAVNAARASGGQCGSQGSFAPSVALGWNTTLEQAAVAHSSEMAQYDYFSHTDRSGGSVGARATAAGYTWSAVAENIAAGYGSSASVMQAWMGSEGHCANILDSGLREIAVACVQRSGSTYGSYWTMVLGRANGAP